MDSNQPWLERKEWASNQIKSQAKLSLFVTWGITLVWNLISLPILLDDKIYREIKHSPETALAFLFPLIGLGLFAASIHALIAWRKFGATPLVMDPFPASLGGHIGGTIDTGIPFSETSRFKVSAACIKSYISGSGKNRSRKERILWQTEGVCQATRSGKGTKLSFRFDSPSSLPESEPKKANTYHLWRVMVNCKLPGTDFARQYEIPVFKGIRVSKQLTHGTEEHAETIEEAHDGVYEVAQLSNIAGGIEAYFPAFKRPAGGLFATLFGLTFFGIGLFLTRTDASIILPISFTLTGLLITCFGVWDLGKSLKVTITREGIVSRRFFLSYPITTKRLAADQLKKITSKQGAAFNNGKRSTIYYALKAHPSKGKAITVAERLTSQPEVALLKETMESYLALKTK